MKGLLRIAGAHLLIWLPLEAHPMEALLDMESLKDAAYLSQDCAVIICMDMPTGAGLDRSC